MDKLEQGYRESVTRILQNYQLGLQVALQELEEAEDDKVAQDLLRTWVGLKTEWEKKRYGKNVADLILQYTGRGYLIEQAPTLDNLFKG